MIPCELPTFVIVFVIRNTMFYMDQLSTREQVRSKKEQVKALIREPRDAFHHAALSVCNKIVAVALWATRTLPARLLGFGVARREAATVRYRRVGSEAVADRRLPRCHRPFLGAG